MAHLSTSPLPPFQTLLDEHGPAVHRFLSARVGARDAEDCYQETMLSALRAYPRLRSQANLRAWLMTVAHHKAIDHLRATARAPRLAAEPAPAVAPPAEPASGLDPVWTHVAALPEKQRAAVALRFLADLSHAEIAAAMAISEAAARRNLHEGLKRLRGEIER